MGLFTDIYNTVAKFFRPQEDEYEASKSVATNRLKLVLMQDRTNLTPRILEQMRSELIDLLSRYVELDKELLELNFEQEGSQVALMLSIPVIRAKDEEEIEAALKQKKNEDEEIEKSEDIENIEGEDDDFETDEDGIPSDKLTSEISKNVSTPEEMVSKTDNQEEIKSEVSEDA